MTTSTREESHLDLGFDAVMPAVSTEALDAVALDALVSTVGTTAAGSAFRSLLPAAADPYFRLFDAAGETDAREPGFAVVLVSDGAGELVSDAGRVEVERGQVYAVPHAFGAWRLTGHAEVLVAAPGAGWPRTLRDGSVR